MKAKRLIVGLCSLVWILLGTIVYAEDIPINKNWETNSDDRSLSSSPVLVKKGKTILVHSDMLLENLSIAITGKDGQKVYWAQDCVTVDMEYTIPIEELPAGDYCITVMQGTNYVMGYFQINQE